MRGLRIMANESMMIRIGKRCSNYFVSASAVDAPLLPLSSWNTFFRQRPLHQPKIVSSSISSCAGLQNIVAQPKILYRPTQHNIIQQLPFIDSLTQQQQQHRKLSSRAADNSNNRGKKNKIDANIPLLNEHLVAELFNQKKRHSVTADTYEVRLIIDQGYNPKANKNGDDGGDEDSSNNESSSTPTTQVTTLDNAISISHELSLDLMEVTLQQSPPVIKAVNFDRWLYEQKKKEKAAQSKKKKEGGGAISDRPLKEFKFRAGIADHDLERKANNMIKYLGKGHAIRVTLTARQRSLNADAAAIETTLNRVKELVGDKAVEVRGMKANERKSYGNLLLHPNKSAK